MKITACPKCGSKRIFQGRLGEGVLAGYTTRDVCRDCGYRGSPIIFDSEKEYKKFIEKLKNSDKKEKHSSDKIEDKSVELSDKEKEIIDFLKEIEEETYEEIDDNYQEKRTKILNNPATSLGFGIFIVGLLVTSVTFGRFIIFTGLLVFAGIILFLIGLIGPSKEKLQTEIYKEKMKKLPKIAGILLIINASANAIIYFFMLFIVLMYDQIYEIYGSDKFNELIFLIGEYQTLIVTVLSIELIFCLFLFIGGLFALLRRRWGFAILGSVLGIFLIPVFYIPVVISFIGLVLIAYSRYIFQK